ncbi:MAG: phosphoribosylaminoimidazolesuccinocarboxamide synthase [Methanobacteriaceae archaeon]|nr:phosphoribosylaminoimidazolesuccinocarboxamide synthase [Methanobacteriaceae archaeon]
MNLEVGKLLYQGKDKDVYQTNHPHQVMVKFRDDITVGNSEKQITYVKMVIKIPLSLVSFLLTNE